MLEEAEHIRRHTYDKKSFAHKLDEMREVNSIIPPELILDKLKDKFTYGELRKCIEESRKAVHLASDKEYLFNKYFIFDFTFDDIIIKLAYDFQLAAAI